MSKIFLPKEESEIKKLFFSIGFSLIEEKNNILVIKRKTMVSVKDRKGYMYFTTIGKIISESEKLAIVDKYNPYSILNIKKWIEINNKNFDLCEDNKYVGCYYKLKLKCNVCGENFNMNWANMKQGRGCGVCHGLQVVEKTSLSFLRPDLSKEWSDINDCSPSMFTLFSQKMVWWECSDCGYLFKSIISSRNRKIDSKNGCPSCAGKIVSDRNRLSLLFPELAEEWDCSRNKNISADDISHSSNKKVWWKCKKCDFEWKATPSSRTSLKRGCPKCSSSKGEKEISKYLIENNIGFSSEKSFPDCKNKGLLFFDFYIPDFNICIEYQGKQHYEPVERFGGESSLKNQKIKDNIKRIYCDEKKIRLVEIPYWDFDNIEKILRSLFNFRKEDDKNAIL